jgi:hypothetical protein
VAVGRLGEGAELLDSVAEDQGPLPRPGYVRNTEGELPRPRGQPGDASVEGPETPDRMEEGIQRVGVVIELPLVCLGVDRA